MNCLNKAPYKLGRCEIKYSDSDMNNTFSLNYKVLYSDSLSYSVKNNTFALNFKRQRAKWPVH